MNLFDKLEENGLVVQDHIKKRLDEYVDDIVVSDCVR